MFPMKEIEKEINRQLRRQMFWIFVAILTVTICAVVFAPTEGLW